ncbi:MAG: succinate--CoA ligase subunit beta, partial [Candidatus Zixiibacteriota bacterium]
LAGEFNKPIVLKSQVLTGGRGKAGGVKFASGPQEAKSEAEKLFDLKVGGFPVEKILIEEKLKIEKELYLGITLDRANYRIVILACPEGGVEIEEVAKRDPQKILKLSLDIDEKFYQFQGLVIAKWLEVNSPQLREVGAIAGNLFRLFKDYDAKLMEINPLVLTSDGKYIAADSRISLDDDALFRHPDLKEMGIEKRHEEGELTPREIQARERDIPYLDLDGDIGMFPGGAGFGIMGNDFVSYFDGKPANFMDSGGGPTPERLANMLVLLDENPKVKAIFAARFGGISRCDDFAKGVIKFLKEHGLSKPMVMRMTGNMWQEGVRMFEEARKESPGLFEKLEFHGIEVPIEEIAKKAVELAKEAG